MIKHVHVLGTRPLQSKGSLLRVTVKDSDPPSTEVWSAKKKSAVDNTLTISVTPSARAIIGKYSLFVESGTTGDNGNQQTNRTKFEDNFIVLFNPWCKGTWNFKILPDNTIEGETS